MVMKRLFLSIARPALFGADTRFRTQDLLLTRQLLYQLSYTGVIEIPQS